MKAKLVKEIHFKFQVSGFTFISAIFYRSFLGKIGESFSSHQHYRKEES